MGLGGLHALQGAKRAWAAPGVPLVLSWASAVGAEAGGEGWGFRTEPQGYSIAQAMLLSTRVAPTEQAPCGLSG